MDQQQQQAERYLGDGAYARFTGNAIAVYLKSGIGEAVSTIVLEPDTFRQLVALSEQLGEASAMFQKRADSVEPLGTIACANCGCELEIERDEHGELRGIQ